VTNFCVKSSEIIRKLAQIFSSACQKQNNFQFSEIYGYKKGMTTNFFCPSLLLQFLDSGSEIRGSGSGMGKNQDPGSGINIPDPQHWIEQS
jgi:hypothetical protein